MFLTAGNILRPVAGVSLLVVEKSTNTELLGGCSIPAGPVAGAGGLVAKYSVQPVTVLRALGGISSFSVIAVDVVRIVTGPQQTEGSTSIVHETVWTCLDESLVTVALVVEITLTLMSSSLDASPAALCTTRGWARGLGSPQVVFEIVRVWISLGEDWWSGPGRVQGGQGNGGGGFSVKRVGQLIIIINIVAGVFINICTPSVLLIVLLSIH